jgi:sugar (pentulose or hexulose) kinase
VAADRVVAVDIGTQSTRAALVDIRGRIHDIASSPIELDSPQPGWAEQDPDQWWETTVANIATIMARNPGARVAAVGVGAQMHSLVAVDASGALLTRRSAIWSDKRCLDQVRAVLGRPDAGELCQLAGNRPLPAWAGFKMAWLRSRASFIGATLGHDRAHFVRAVLEGITLEDRRALRCLCPHGPREPIRCVGGGAQSRLWNQIRADIFGHPVQTVTLTEGGIQGAAILAGVGAGWYSDAAAGAEEVIRAAETWTPSAAAARRYEAVFRRFCAVHDALDELWSTWTTP